MGRMKHYCMICTTQVIASAQVIHATCMSVAACIECNQIRMPAAGQAFTKTWPMTAPLFPGACKLQ
jgi:hypothetical protein